MTRAVRGCVETGVRCLGVWPSFADLTQFPPLTGHLRAADVRIRSAGLAEDG